MSFSKLLIAGAALALLAGCIITPHHGHHGGYHGHDQDRGHHGHRGHRHWR